jgi:valyl-tRNA synthetase
MPFITEEIWQKLPGVGKSVMIAPFPQYDPLAHDPEAENILGLVADVISCVRNIRGEMNINPGMPLNLLIKTGDGEKEKILNGCSAYIRELAKIADLKIGGSAAKPAVAASSALDGIDVIVPLEGMMDFAEEKKRIEKELKKIEKDILFLDRKLSNPEFVDKAPPEIIDKDKLKQRDLTEKRSKLLSHLKTVELGMGK